MGPQGSKSDRSFEELALEQGLISADQLEECRRVRAVILGQGMDCDLEEVLLKKGYVTKAQAIAIHTALGRGNRTAIEGYEILEKLGAGGQGAVYKARQSSMDRLVALKVLPPKYAKDKEGIQRFLREARAIARLNHPNIVAGIDAGFSNGIYYYVMEYVEGESLSRRIARLGTLPWRDAVSIVRQVALALDHAHANGLVHRDVKPANVMLTPDGTAKLADLGMARFAGQEGMTITQPGLVVGTPHYIAPEQARGEEAVDVRADLYSLGITFYEMLAGKPPYTGKDPLVVLNKHVNDTVRFEFPEVPQKLLWIGHRLTERDRARRYASPAELLEDLESFGENRTLAHARLPVRAKTTRKAVTVRRQANSRTPVVIGVAAAVLLGILVVAVGFSGSADPPAPRPAVRPAPKQAAVPPAPPPPKEKLPAPPKDRAALKAFTRVREYERANPTDLEEIAGQYARLADQIAGTAYAEDARRKAEQARSDLDAAIESRKKEIDREIAGLVGSKNFGKAIDALKRHGKDFRSEPWRRWIEGKRTEVKGRLGKEAEQVCKRIDAAEAEGDFEGAIAAIRELANFGDPALSREAADLAKAIETSRRNAEAARGILEKKELGEVSAFLDKADAWASGRKYDEIRRSAPSVASPKAKEALTASLAVYAQAEKVFDTARDYALSRKGKLVKLELRKGGKVSGRIQEVLTEPPTLLIAGKPYRLDNLTAAGVVGLYRAARGRGAGLEGILFFSVFEGEVAEAEKILERKLARLPDRLKPLYREGKRVLAEEAAAEIAQEKAARASREKARAAREEAARAKAAPDVLVNASDIASGALTDEMVHRDDPSSPGGRMLDVLYDPDVKDPLPEIDATATFKMQVQGGIPYRCWIHMKVGKPMGRSKANLLWVQFTNATDKAQKQIFTLGTVECLVIRGGSREGWSWVGRDLSDPRAVEPEIYFRSSGEITVRVLGGMGGVGFDQFLLSPARYLAKPPAGRIVGRPGK